MIARNAIGSHGPQAAESRPCQRFHLPDYNMPHIGRHPLSVFRVVEGQWRYFTAPNEREIS